jgi:cell division protein FtsI/penicillin-binding protein 2
MVAGALARQGDGQRRFTYNPRLLAAAERIVRGTIFDRNGLPLATSRSDVLAEHAAALTRLGAPPAADCAGAQRRCYPLGGPLFHVLGDAETRLNWAAPNSSYVERDRDARLRGYDDQARVVDIVDPVDGSRSRAIRRNLRPLLPLWVHRDQPDHPEVRALLDTPRDVRLTLDVRLQLRVASLLRARLATARLQRGAAVVVDASSGALLASVSYPWPDAGGGAGTPGSTEEAIADRLIDRARYGVYPPGSTFKLVTAAAVLRSVPALAEEPLVCRRLDDRRVGNVVSGWRRPVRDDVTDTVPHGDVTLDRGLVVSCNAYFAQLGARLGGARLREAAALFDIALVRGDAAPQRLRDTLPFAAYGQGDVLATPFRMARVAAAIANDGALPPPQLVAEGGPATDAAAVRVLEASASRRLAAAMREVVVSGTGRGLMAHPELVAGKTGTAEVDGAASHSWFVGFAPYAAGATRRVAFAVIVENGGYGGRAAAPLAGEIVSAARDLGLLGPASQ